MRLIAAVLVAATAVGAAAAAQRSGTTFVPAVNGVLTGGGSYSYIARTFDRAAKNGYPNRSRFLGEAYLGDGGATVTYTIKRLAAKPQRFWLWINVTDDGLHRNGERAVAVSIPKLRWSTTWINGSEDTQGWKAVRIGAVRTAGGFAISFRKLKTTQAAFVLNAFAFTTSAQAPSFAPAAQ